MEGETLGAPMKLLLVEDDEVDREAVRRLLGAGYVVTNAATGKEALELIAASPPMLCCWTSVCPIWMELTWFLALSRDLFRLFC